MGLSLSPGFGVTVCQLQRGGEDSLTYSECLDTDKMNAQPVSPAYRTSTVVGNTYASIAGIAVAVLDCGIGEGQQVRHSSVHGQ